MTALSIRKAGNNDRIFKINTLMKRPEFFKAANDIVTRPRAASRSKPPDGQRAEVDSQPRCPL
jgi:hypothetical protein